MSLYKIKSGNSHEDDVEEDSLHGIETHIARQRLVVNDAQVDSKERYKSVELIEAERKGGK